MSRFVFLGLTLLASTASAAGSQNCKSSLTTWCCAFSSGPANLVAADNAMSALSKSEDFAAAAAFSKEMNRVSAITDSKEKMQGYVALASVKTSAEIAQFLGARGEAKQAYVSALAKNLDLTDAQANKVLGALTAALRGDHPAR